MTRDDIIRMAREARLGTTLTHQGGEPRVWIEGADWHDEVKRFAALVAAAEREACAVVADEHEEDCYDGDSDWYKCRSIAAAIRSRGTT
jgi:hypothetical protein